MALARRVVMSLVPLVVLVVGAEGALRAAGYPPTESSKDFTHNQVYWKEDPNLHLDPRPHKETGGTFRVSTDANGLRTPLHAEQKPSGTFRVMTLGCSTTFGWGVNDEESYPARLEALLRERGFDQVEVINGGQRGHTSFQGLWLWDTTLHKYSPDLVIFGYLVQDARKVAYTDQSQALLQQNAEFLKRQLLYSSRLYLSLKLLLDRRQIQTKDQNGEVQRVPLDQYVENLRAFHERISRVGAKLVLFGYPLERAGYTDSYRKVLASASQDEGLGTPAVHDPQPEFERFTATRTLFFPQDRGHANPDGNDLIARGMADFLVGQKLLPARSATGM